MKTKRHHKWTLFAVILLVQSGNLAAAVEPQSSGWLSFNNGLLVLMALLIIALVFKVKHTAAKLSRLRADLDELSRTDHPTQLFKRHYFEKRLYEVFELHIRNKSSNSVLMLVEIDQMDEIKKNGQTAQELVVQRVVKIILERIRHTDLSGRFADDAFIILLRDTTIEPASKLVKELQTRIKEAEINYGQQSIQTTCSFGLAAYNENMDSCIDWIRSTDLALNAGKSQGHVGVYQ